MSAPDWLAILAGVAAIAWVNWYFLLGDHAGRTPEAGTTDGAGR